MQRVGILTDATASIPPSLADDLHITIVPCTAASPTQDAYVQAFKQLAEKTDAIAALTPSAGITHADANCCAAAAAVRTEMSGLEIRVVDTRQAAMAQGWAAIEAARAASKGATLLQVVQHANAVAARAFMVQTAATFLDAQVLVGIANGEIVSLGAVPAREIAFARMVELVCAQTRTARRVHLAFTYCDAAAQTERLRDLYFREMNCIEEMTMPLAPTLAVHPGTGAVGVCLYAE